MCDNSDTVDVIVRGQPMKLTGRVAKIVTWLVDTAVKIEKPEKVSITFDCAGGDVQVELRERNRLKPSK